MKSICVFLLGLFALSSGAYAKPVKFVHQGVASGTLAGNPFGNTTFIITAKGDTQNRFKIQGHNTYQVIHDRAEIELDGIGTFGFLQSSHTFANWDVGTVGFTMHGDRVNGPYDALFTGWNMLSSIGPISGTGKLLQWEYRFGEVETTGGTLYLSNADIVVTFTAVVTPEPTSSLLAAGSLLLLAVRRR